MGNYGKIVTGSWHDNPILAESVPHLLHWDIAYLWILEKDKDIRPISWRTKIEDWRNLVIAFFTGQLEIEKKDIAKPLSEYTKPYGIEAVYWLRNRNTKELVGVLSPTVLVRPLPNYQETQFYTDDTRNQCKFVTLTDNTDSIYNSIFPYFLTQAIKKLELVDETQSLYCKRLAGILKREFPQQLNAVSDKVFPSTKQATFFIRQLYWETRDLKTIEGNKINLEFPIYFSDFHEDVVYNWILEKEKDSRTANELERIQAWKLLVVAFFTGQVEIAQENIVTLDTQAIVGQLSSTVLLRPTLTYSDYAKYQFGNIDKNSDNIYNDIFTYFLTIAIKEIEKCASDYSKDLVAIFKTEFRDELTKALDKPFPFIHQSISFIRELHINTQTGNTSKLQATKNNKIPIEVATYNPILHKDIVYLWILEKQNSSRPSSWQDRIKAWQLLVVAFFESKVSIEAQTINNEITHLLTLIMVRSDGSVEKEKIGLLSPTVLVRPLPNYQDKDCEKWGITIPNNYNDKPFIFFLKDALKKLRDSSSIYCQKLAEILKREFEVQLGYSSSLDDAPRADHIQVSFFNSPQLIKSTNKSINPDLAKVELSTLFHKSLKYIPSCTKCGKKLTYRQDQPAFKAEESTVRLKCLSCPAENVIPLYNFFIWCKDKENVVAWHPDLPAIELSLLLAPIPKIEGSIVEFEWSANELRGEANLRWLKIFFPDKSVEKIKFSSLLYKDLLVLGDFSSFDGYPIKSEHFDAFESQKKVEIKPSFVKYELKIKGTPGEFPYLATSLVKELNLALGIFPNPNNLPDSWKWYRYFLHGENRQDFVLHVAKSKKIFPFLVESNHGDSKIFSVTKNLSPDLGVSYIPIENRQFRSLDKQKLDIGIDFGTTNTIVYFRYEDLAEVENITTETSGLKPSEISSKELNTIYWAATVSQTSSMLLSQNIIADFLPGEDYGKEKSDPYIIPSVAWCLGIGNSETCLIRWGNNNSLPNAIRKANFKWGEENQNIRQNYLSEVLCLSLPTIFAKNDNKVPREIRIGVSFPLAFSSDEQERLRNLWGDSLKKHLTNLTGLSFTAYAIDESYAALKAYGARNSHEVLLVADMGGATLDLALFSGDMKKIYQIGSLKFAGNNFLRALCEKEQGSVRQREEKEWELRDLIFQGRAYPNPDAFPTLKKFFVLSLEFLRTMIEAYRKSNNDPDKKITVILAGNGWRLVETFDPQIGKQNRKRIFDIFYQQLKIKLAPDPKLLELEANPPKSITHSKHIVAKGALENATDKKNPITKDEEIKVHFCKLPSGRKIVFSQELNQITYEWYDLIGEDEKVTFKFSPEDLENMDMDFDLSDFDKSNTDWISLLNNVFENKMNETYPEVTILRQDLRREINKHGSTDSLIKKGPLQIILEKEWSAWLGKK